MKLLLSVLLSLFVAVSFGQVDKSSHSLLWEITGNDLEKPSYLFGTMHVQDERAHEFTDSTLVCLDATDAFAMEVNIDSIIHDILRIYLEGDTTNVLKKMLSKEAYDRLNKRMIEQTGESLEEMDNKNPEYVQELLTDWDEPDYTIKKEQIVDMYLMKRAAEQGHRTYGLETMDDYIGVTQSYFKLFENENEEAEPNEEEKNSVYEQLIDIYQRGDLDLVESTFVDKENQTEYDIEMLDKRNKKMVLNLMKLMKTQTVFCAVGTAHLPGKEGMLEELKRQGYKVRKVKAEFEGYANSYEKTTSKTWEVFESKTHLYKVKAPGTALSLKDQIKEIGPNSSAHMNMNMLDQHVYIHMVMNLTDINKNVEMDTIDEQAFLESWAGKSGSELQKSMDISRSGIAGKRFFTKEESGDKVVWEVFLIGKLVYVFSVVKEGGLASKENYEAYFGSIEFVERKWQRYESEQGAYSIEFPMPPAERRASVKREYENRPEGEMILKSQVVKDPLKSITYLIRSSNMDEGSTITDSKEWLMSTLTAMYDRFGEPKYTIDSLNYKGFFTYKANFELKQTFFEVCLFNRGNRGVILGVECPKTGNFEKEKQRFYESLVLKPFQKSKINPVDFEGETFTMSFPGKIAKTYSERSDYPYYAEYGYAAIDSMHSGNFQLDVYHLNPYYMPTSKDSSVVNFSKETFAPEENRVAIDTTFQGRKAVYLRVQHEKVDTRIYELLFYDDLYLFDMIVYLSNELDEAIAWEYFNSFKNKKQYEANYLLKDKKDLLFKALTGKDTTDMKFGLRAMDYVEFSTKDLPEIYKVLDTKKTGTSEKRKEVESVLIREFQYTNDETTIPFLEKLFYKKKNNRDAQLDMLNTLAKMKSKPAFDLFFKLANDLPIDKDVNLVHNAMFNDLIDTMTLSMSYVESMVRMTDDPSFSYYVYDFLVRACYSDSSNVELIEPWLPNFLAQAKAIVTTNKLTEVQDSVNYFDFYPHLNKLNALLSYYKKSEEVGAYYQHIKNIPDAYLLINIIDAMLMRNDEVDLATIEKVAEDSYHWNRLISAIAYENNLDKIPSYLFTPEKTVESIASRRIQDDNDVMTNFKIIDTRKHTLSGEELRIYTFTFEVKGYTGVYVGACSQPIDKAQTISNYFDYNTTPYEAEKKESIIAEFLSSWE